MTKRLIHSHSSLSMHDKCPEQFNQVRVMKRFPYVPGPEAVRGTAIHTAFENLGLQGTPMPAEFAHMQWAYNDYAGKFKGTKYFEHKFDFTQDGFPINERDWDNKKLTGMADVLIVNGASAFVGDYKSGKAGYPDVKQLERMAVFTMWKFLGVNTVVGALLFVEHDGKPGTAGKPVVLRTYTRVELPTLVDNLKRDMRAVEQDNLAGTWELRPGPLCPWCPVTDCSNWKPPKPKSP